MRTIAILLLSLVSILSGCTSDRSTWSYSLSRKFYDSKNWERSWSGSSLPIKEGTGQAAFFAIAFFFVPVVIDTAILPITGTHDILVATGS